MGPRPLVRGASSALACASRSLKLGAPTASLTRRVARAGVAVDAVRRTTRLESASLLSGPASTGVVQPRSSMRAGHLLLGRVSPANKQGAALGVAPPAAEAREVADVDVVEGLHDVRLGQVLLQQLAGGRRPGVDAREWPSRSG